MQEGLVPVPVFRHGIDITQSIRCCNLSKKIRIIYWWREKINGLNQGLILIHLINSRIITGTKANQKLFTMLFRKLSQYLPEYLRSLLGRSATLCCHRCQFILMIHNCHLLSIQKTVSFTRDRSLSGGSMWESNPPKRELTAITGFEDQEAHQHLSTPIFIFIILHRQK